MKILVVEDDPGLRAALEAMILSLGHEVGSVANGQDALALIERYPPDIVLTDRRMPMMGGEELCRNIRKSKPRLPIILLTGDDFSSTEERAIIAAGANTILSKRDSISKEVLARAIAAVVSQPAPAPS